MASEFLRDPYYFVTVGRVGSTTNLITQVMQLLPASDCPPDLFWAAAALVRKLMHHIHAYCTL